MKKEIYLSTMLFVSLIASATQADSTQQNNKMVSTPFGLRPSQCVHVHPSGTLIRETATGVEAVAPDGSVQIYPMLKECDVADKKWRAAYLKAREQKLKYHLTTDGWLDYAWAFPPKPMTSFTANYLVPNNPAAGKLNYWLYYFIGMENSQSNEPLTILQPVLAWSSVGWNFASWNCCPSGQVHSSAPVPVDPNTLVQGSIKQSGTNWIIDSESLNKHSTLQVPANGREFNVVDTTLETYYVQNCSYFPTRAIEFTSMILQTASGVFSPQWGYTSGATECAGKISIINPSMITIQHN